MGRNVGIGGTWDLIKLHAWGSNRMNVQPGSSPQWLRRILLNKLFICNYLSMFHFVITGFIGFFEKIKLEMYCKEIL